MEADCNSVASLLSYSLCGWKLERSWRAAGGQLEGRGIGRQHFSHPPLAGLGESDPWPNEFGEGGKSPTVKFAARARVLAASKRRSRPPRAGRTKRVFHMRSEKNSQLFTGSFVIGVSELATHLQLHILHF